MVEGVWDFKSYFEPHLNKIEGHSKYAVFRLIKTDSGHEMQYKYYQYIQQYMHMHYRYSPVHVLLHSITHPDTF